VVRGSENSSIAVADEGVAVENVIVERAGTC
jgi:hypothetical protein